MSRQMEQKRNRASKQPTVKESTVLKAESNGTVEQNPVIPNKRILPIRLQGKCRYWSFTDFDVTVENVEQKMDQYKVWMDSIGGNVYMNPEKCDTTGRPHIQGCLEYPSPVVCNSILKKWGDKLHLEKTRKREAAKKYCQKKETKIAGMESIKAENIKPLKDKLSEPDTKLYPFQEEIMKIIEQEPDSRTIHWYHGPDGCMGKTALARHILIKNRNKALYLNGKVADIEYAVAQYVMAHGETTLIVCLFDFPREQSLVSYQALEKVKDGILFSGKYESGHTVFNPPHIICMANFEPRLENTISKDRWIITDIENETRKTFKKIERETWEIETENKIYKKAEQEKTEKEKYNIMDNVNPEQEYKKEQKIPEKINKRCIWCRRQPCRYWNEDICKDKWMLEREQEKKEIAMLITG